MIKKIKYYLKIHILENKFNLFKKWKILKLIIKIRKILDKYKMIYFNRKNVRQLKINPKAQFNNLNHI